MGAEFDPPLSPDDEEIVVVKLILIVPVSLIALLTAR